MIPIRHLFFNIFLVYFTGSFEVFLHVFADILLAWELISRNVDVNYAQGKIDK